MSQVRLLNISDTEEITKLYIKNRERLRPFGPTRKEEFFTADYQREIIEKANDNKDAFLFGIFDDNKLIGRIALTGIAMGAFKNAFLGYWIDKEYEKKGLMTASVKEVVDYAFNKLNLHRIEAGVMPSNKESLRVLEKCGFERIGLARKYLYLDGVWQDHYLHQIINEK